MVAILSIPSILFVASVVHAQSSTRAREEETACVGVTCRPTPPASSVAATPSYSSPEETVDLLWPAESTRGPVVERPYLRHGHDPGLIGAGVTLLGVGMALGLALGIATRSPRAA